MSIVVLMFLTPSRSEPQPPHRTVQSDSRSKTGSDILFIFVRMVASPFLWLTANTADRVFCVRCQRLSFLHCGFKRSLTQIALLCLILLQSFIFGLLPISCSSSSVLSQKSWLIFSRHPLTLEFPTWTKWILACPYRLLFVYVLYPFSFLFFLCPDLYLPEEPYLSRSLCLETS